MKRDEKIQLKNKLFSFSNFCDALHVSNFFDALRQLRREKKKAEILGRVNQSAQALVTKSNEMLLDELFQPPLELSR